MINVSNAFKQGLENGEKVWIEVDITFSNGTSKHLKNEIMSGNNSFSDCAESSSFPIGCVICKSMTLELDNTSDQWKDYYFYMAKVHAYLKMQIDADTVETIDKGVYTVTTPEQYGEILNLTALDDMYKANAPYTSNLVLPQSAFTLLRDACATIGISMGFSSMEHGDVVVSSIPDGITFRQLIGWVAMLDSANARVDINGNLQLIKWNFDSVSVDYGATVGADGYLTFEGGSNADYDGFISPNAGNWYLDSDGYLTLKEGVGNPTRLRDYLSSPTLSSDDIVITGIKVKNTESDAMYGKDGYVLELENDLLSDADLETVAGWIGDNLIGKSFRSMEGSLIYNPLTEFGDMAFTYDRKENKYITPITDVSSRLNGTTDVKTKAENPIRGSSKFLSSADKTLIAAKKIIENEKTAREQAVKKLENALANSEGLFETIEVLEDKSVITYLHDKPLLEESKVVIKLTSNAIGVSNDGGETYPYGFVVDGTLITRLLYAEGINANYIDSGALTVRDSDGNIIFQADMNTKKVYLDGSVQIGGGKSINDIKQTAENAMKAAALAKNMTLQLSNEYQGISVDSNGNYGTFPSGVTTQAVVMYGTQDITADCSYTISKSDGVDGTWDISTKTYTVTGLNTDNGWIDIKATYLETLSVSKRFSVSKQYAGEKGEQGNAGRTYFFQSNADVLLMGADQKIIPASLIVDSFYRDGNSEIAQAQKGWWKLEKSTDNGVTWSALTVSQTVVLDRLSININNLSLKAHNMLKVSLYFDQAKTKLADYQTFSVAVDVASLTHEDIFNLLTNNGSIKAIRKEGNQLYISFTYAKGGTLKLGGPNNGYGTFEVYDANGNIITQIDNSVGFKNFKGKEWFQINESVATAGYDSSLVHGLLDLSAQYSDGYWTVLESKQAGLLLKTVSRMKVETTGSSSLTLNVPEMPKLVTGSNLGKNNNGDVGTIASSSMHYKVLGKTVKEDELEDLYKIKVIWAKYKDGYLMEQDERCSKEMPMFIAEDIDRRFPIAVDHNEKGHAENWNYRIMIPCMFAMLKNEHEKVKELQSELESIKTELTELKELINQCIVKKEV